jgi:hypothetical protein
MMLSFSDGSPFHMLKLCIQALVSFSLVKSTTNLYLLFAFKVIVSPTYSLNNSRPLPTAIWKTKIGLFLPEISSTYMIHLQLALAY